MTGLEGDGLTGLGGRIDGLEGRNGGEFDDTPQNRRNPLAIPLSRIPVKVTIAPSGAALHCRIAASGILGRLVMSDAVAAAATLYWWPR